MSFFEQMKQQMQEQLNQQQQASYLLPSDLNTVVELLYKLSGGRITQPDVNKLECCKIQLVSIFKNDLGETLWLINPILKNL